MPKRPPQGRGSGGRVTPSPKSASASGSGAGRTGAGGRVLQSDPKKARTSRGSDGSDRTKRYGAEPDRPGRGDDADATSERAPAATVFAKVRALFAPTDPSHVPAADRVRPWWGSGDVVIWFLIGQVGLGIAFALALKYGDYAVDRPMGDGSRLGEVVGRIAAGQPVMVTPTVADMPLWLSQGVNMVPLWAAFVAGPVFVAWRKGRGLLVDFKAAFAWRDLPLGLALGAAAQLIWNPLVYFVFFKFAGEQDVSAGAADITAKATSPALVVLLFVTVAFVAPVAEELFFRGLAHQAFTRRLGRFWGLMASSMFFALVHGNLLYVLALFPFAALLGWLVNRYDRLGPAVSAHIAYNVITASTLVWNLHLPGL